MSSNESPSIAAKAHSLAYALRSFTGFGLLISRRRRNTAGVARKQSEEQKAQ